MSEKLFRETTDYLSPADDGLRVNRPSESHAEQIARQLEELNADCGGAKVLGIKFGPESVALIQAGLDAATKNLQAEIATFHDFALTRNWQEMEAKLGAAQQEVTALRGELATAKADYEELKRVTKLLQMGNRSGKKR